MAPDGAAPTVSHSSSEHPSRRRQEHQMPSAISMAGLTKHYKGVQALTDLTLDVPAGTVFGFLGPNGAGKTTALKVLAGPRPRHRRHCDRRRRAGLGRRRPPPRARLPRPGPALLRLDDRPRDAPPRRPLPRPRPGPRALDRPAARARRHRRRRRSPDRRPTRAACASGWASPRPSSAGRRSSCSTSPSRRSTRSAARTSST